VIEHLDVFARVAMFAALDLTFPDIAATKGELKIDFVPEVESPALPPLRSRAKRSRANQLRRAGISGLRGGPKSPKPCARLCR